ncbi:DUF6708 domain-containing protein [Aquabacterium sp.]|uniref:DUF6708 domain-containing protein n=1 Tax=Aquabacterium sp. TaxID=1872578 RepID=UPI004037F006
MDFLGLFRKFPINRPLTSLERLKQVKQGIRLSIEPDYMWTVIRSNSTYLEVVDKFHVWKGFATSFLSMLIVVCLSIIGFVVIDAIQTYDQPDGQPLWFFLFITGMFGTLIAIFVWLIRKESFAYTHYPIRFNRVTKTVHVFRLDGTVLSVKWNDIHFCLVSAGQGFWNLVGHVLEADRKTVRETFPLPMITGGSDMQLDGLRGYWEFVRRYMEEGPKDAAQRVEVLLPIAEQRDTVARGFQRLYMEGAGNPISALFYALLAAFAVPGRWFAMHTSKIPMWPDEIEASCRVPVGDPFAIGMTT